MNSSKLSDHVVLHYPLLGRYCVFFREGGAQNFDMTEGELPNTLQKYIRECRDSGQYEEVRTKLVPCEVKGEAPENKSFVVVFYSKMYSPGTTSSG